MGEEKIGQGWDNTGVYREAHGEFAAGIEKKLRTIMLPQETSLDVPGKEVNK
nr:hypothetical protein [Treponema primitia]